MPSIQAFLAMENSFVQLLMFSAAIFSYYQVNKVVDEVWLSLKSEIKQG